MAIGLTWFGVLHSDGRLTMGTEDRLFAREIARITPDAVAVVRCLFRSKAHLEASLSL